MKIYLSGWNGPLNLTCLPQEQIHSITPDIEERGLFHVVGIGEGDSPYMWYTRLVRFMGIYTVCVKRNAHLNPIFFMPPLGEGDQKFTGSIM